MQLMSCPYLQGKICCYVIVYAKKNKNGEDLMILFEYLIINLAADSTANLACSCFKLLFTLGM